MSAFVLVAQAVVPVATYAQASVDPEWMSAYEFMKDNGLTSATTYEGFNPLNGITREQLAAFASRYYAKVLMKTEKVEDASCTFTDQSMIDSTLVAAVTDACEYGLMGVGITAFNPKGNVTRGEVLTVMSRMLYGDENNGGTPFWANHEQALYDAGIVTKKHPEVDANGPMNRIFTSLMMVRASEDVEDDSDIDCTDPLFSIFCEEEDAGTGNVVEPTEEDNTTTGTVYDDDNRPTSNAAVTLTASSKLANLASIPQAGIVTFANMKLTTTSDAAEVYRVSLKRT